MLALVWCFAIYLATNLLSFFPNRGCPEELEEAISSLIYASTRCGEFPELQDMRAMFTSRFGREFTASAVDLRNNCRVNSKVYCSLLVEVHHEYFFLIQNGH